MGTQKGHDFGRYIRRSRVDAGVSLRAAARAIGVSAVYLGEVERGVRPPLKQKWWDDLIKAVPTLDRSAMDRLSASSRPLQLDLRDVPPKYQDLGMALARRIERQNISVRDFDRLSAILGSDPWLVADEPEKEPWE